MPSNSLNRVPVRTGSQFDRNCAELSRHLRPHLQHLPLKLRENRILPNAPYALSVRHSCQHGNFGDQKSNASDFVGLPVIREISGADIGVPGSRKRLVIGYRRSRPKFFSVTFTPGAAWRRLYSAILTIRSMRMTVSRSNPAATIAEIGSSCSTNRSKMGSSTA